jgi:hypothetical protein
MSDPTQEPKAEANQPPLEEKKDVSESIVSSDSANENVLQNSSTIFPPFPESKGSSIPNEEKHDEIQESEWEMVDLPSIGPFLPLSSDLILNILNTSRTIHPIIREIFEKIYSICLQGFNFGGDKIPLEKYKTFFHEVNRLIPSLQKKILEEDCKSAVFYVGDSHGSIWDSFLVIDFFFKIITKDPHAKFVFVGDYVDRNPWDLQNLAFIVAFALLCPNNVILLRGNHEDRTINTHYGFIDNLERVFWEEGDELYKDIIKFFMHLPLAHIAQMYNTDGQMVARVIATHGGIPVDPYNFFQPIILSEIEPKLVCERERSEEMDMFTNSLLWSDPDEMAQGIINDGSSGRMRFGEPVFRAFMNANRLHFMVRGHQKWNDGYKPFFKHSLYSLFSTSRYDNQKKFNPKILKLILNQAPKVLKIEREELDAEAKAYS